MTKSHIALFIIPAAILFAGFTGSTELPVQSAAEEEITPALRARTDMARGLRWELRWGNVAVYEVATERLVRTIALPGATLSGAAESCTPDMLIARSGAVWISSNAEAVLWRISPERFEVERFEIDVRDSRSLDVGFSGLVLTGDEREIYAASAATGTLWKIDLASAKAAPVGLDAPIVGACGLRLAAGAGTQRQPTLAVMIGSVKGARRVQVTVARTTELAYAR